MVLLQLFSVGAYVSLGVLGEYIEVFTHNLLVESAFTKKEG